jgi:hypothetical protein
MLTLFNKFKSENQVSKAVLVGRNLFNKNPADSTIFTAYFEHLCELAELLTLLTERKDLAGQAGTALAFYSENAELTEDIVAGIISCEQRIASIYEEIARAEQAKAEEAFARIKANNADCLRQLYSLKDSLYGSATEETFNAVLAKLGEVDARIDKDALTQDQSGTYDTFTKEYTTLISDKMREFEYKKNIKYNKQAVEAFAAAFKKFREDESKYKNQTQLFSLVSSTLFAYDASRLFNETLIYYNHVYSYIFSKLDDDGKLALTRYSIECERKLR